MIGIEVDELEADNKAKDKEIAKLTKTIAKSKSKKETQSLVEELISLFPISYKCLSLLRGGTSRSRTSDATSACSSRDGSKSTKWS